jgi:hypothetical protein
MVVSFRLRGATCIDEDTGECESSSQIRAWTHVELLLCPSQRLLRELSL